MASEKERHDDGTHDLCANELFANAVAGFRVSVVEGGPSLTWDSTSPRCAIGSQEGNDIQLDDRAVSRFHCEIVMEGPSPG